MKAQVFNIAMTGVNQQQQLSNFSAVNKICRGRNICLHSCSPDVCSMCRYQGAHANGCGRMAAGLLIRVLVGNGSTGHPGKRLVTSSSRG